MTDKLAQEIDRGERAKRILADELITEAKEHIEAELWRMFKETTPQDAETLKFVKGMQYFHGKYFAFFTKAVTDGKIAQINAETRKKPLRERLFG